MGYQKAKVACVGAGLIGLGWAIVFARNGYQVGVYDPNELVRKKFKQKFRESVELLVSCGLVPSVEEVVDYVSVHEELSSAVQGAIFIQESVFESLAVKKEISHELDALINTEVIVGSSSSGIPASAFTQKCKHRGRFLVNHPVNPPHLIPLVEVVPAPWTDSSAIDFTFNFMKELGQKPVIVNAEVDGFILNRLQGALLNEAWALYEEGVASLDDIDATVRDGLGLRWAFMGPFETIDLNAPQGIADYAERLAPLYYKMGNSRLAHQWPAVVIKKAEKERRFLLREDELSERQQWRDKMLMKLLRLKEDN